MAYPNVSSVYNYLFSSNLFNDLVFWKMVDLVPPKSYYPHNELDPSLPSADGKVCFY